MLPTQEAPALDDLEQAILKTVLYSDLFDYVLTPDELTHYLIGAPSSQKEVRWVLSAEHGLRGRIAQSEGYLMLSGCESLVVRRRERLEASRRLWRMARLYVRVLGRLPFVRMIAVTGALALNNSDRHDDVDILLVTASGRVWLARAFAVLVVRLGKLTGVPLCPNYVISQEVLSFEPRTLYVAHEFAQMVPLYGLEMYHRLKAENEWVEKFLPNAIHPLRQEPELRLGRLSKIIKRALEYPLSGRFGDWLENWEMRRKIRKFTARQAGGGNVVFNRDQVKGHFDDHSTRISARFQLLIEKNRLTRSPR